MNNRAKPIGTEDAQRAAERFILDKYPYATIVFESTELKTDDTRQVYQVIGQCRLSKWPKSVGRKNQCEIQVDAYSANIVCHHGMEYVLSS